MVKKIEKLRSNSKKHKKYFCIYLGNLINLKLNSFLKKTCWSLKTQT